MCHADILEPPCEVKRSWFCLPGGSYAGRLSELITDRVTCAQAHLHYHEITSLAPKANRAPQAFNKQELALFIIPKSFKVWKWTCGPF